MSGLLLVIDTATRRGVVGVADADGRLLDAETWATGHRHGEELLSRLDAVLARLDKAARDITCVAVGIGPGSFTGLRIGLATAKTLAYGLDVPLVGIGTVRALALAAAAGAAASDSEIAVALPAGANDRYLTRFAVTRRGVDELAPTQLVTSLGPAVAASSIRFVAVDLDAPEVPDAAVALGRQALDGVAGAIARLAADELAAGRRADVAELVPAYVALPRGITETAASVEWSPDLR